VSAAGSPTSIGETVGSARLLRVQTGPKSDRSDLRSVDPLQESRHRCALSSDSPSKAAGHDMGYGGLVERGYPCSMSLSTRKFREL
jgi:hypothetical protein